MAASTGSNAYFESSTAYDRFMGRYSKPLAKEFIQSIPLAGSDSVLEIGCGPGALTGELVARLGAESVSVIDPSPPFLTYCSRQYPGITAEVAPAEHIPYGDRAFDAVLSQLVIHFVGDLTQAGREIIRVTKPGGWVAMCTWNVERMKKINLLPRAAHAAGIDVPPLPVQEFREENAIARYLESIGLGNVEQSTITVSSTYADFEELWGTYFLTIGPMGPWALARSDDEKAAIKAAMFQILGEPAGELSLSGEARVARGQVPV